MKKGLALLLVFVLSVGTLAAALTPIAPGSQTEHVSDSVFVPPPLLEPEVTYKLDDAEEDELRITLPDSVPSPKTSTTPEREAPSPSEDRVIIPTETDCVLLYQEPKKDDAWVPLPTEKDLRAGRVNPVTFENGTQHLIHGKLFEKVIDPTNWSYYDNLGIPNMTITVTFDGELVPGGQIDRTGNDTTILDPFGETGNGTFEFILDLNKRAGEYELKVDFDGFPATGTKIYQRLDFKAIVYVNHPTSIIVDVSPDTEKVGQPIQITGSLSDDTGQPITSVGLQVKFDNVLLGPTSDGVYIDDVRVAGAGFNDNFEGDEESEWKTSVPPGTGVGNQWQWGSPGTAFGPVAPHSGSKLWGTMLDSNYQRGAWSYLITPRLNLSLDQEYILSFYAWWSVYWEEDYCYLLASMDGGTTWDEENPMTFMGQTLIQVDWTYYEFNVTKYLGSDNVRFAFVFYSVDKTLDVRSDATFSYQFVLPMSTTADRHTVLVVFQGSLLFRIGQGKEEVTVKRITHFDFEMNVTKKTGHRNNPVKLVAWLRDNMGETLQTNIRGIPYIYQVAIFWDRTWTINDGPGEPAGPPRTMNRDNGEVSVNYVVAWNQTLGPANVTFRFHGSDFYTNTEMVDVYYVKANVYVKLPESEELRGFRGKDLDIHGELRVVPDQSTGDQQLGDAVSGEFIIVFWGAERIANRRTQFDGSFSAIYSVPSFHELGDVMVTFSYEGQSLYEASVEYANYTIVSKTFISLQDMKVFKGEWVFINGTIKDDKDQPVANMPVIIIWKRLPEVGRAISKTDGTFSLQHFIEFEDKAENITVKARFKGTKIYLENETAATFTIKVHTILQRRDRVWTLVRGDQVQISARLFEDWGGSKGIEVQRVPVSLLIDDILVNTKRTAFDGTVTFTAPIDPKIFTYGEVPLVLDFNGTEFFESSRNTTKVVIKANSLLTFVSEEFLVTTKKDGKMHTYIYDPSRDTILKEDTVFARLILQDDNYQPIPYGNVSVYYKEEGLRSPKKLINTGTTDPLGYFEFNWTFEVNTEGNKTFIAEYDGLNMDTFLKAGDLIILPTTTEYNVTYEVPEEVVPPLPWWFWAAIGIGVSAFVVALVWSSFYYRRRRQLKKMQRIIRRAADRLMAGNVYAATIFRAYREMANTLRAYGQLRRDSETFREFENAVREAMPIDEENLDEFLTVLEEARYSEHDIGEGEKNRAISALRNVQSSIEKILLSDEDAAKIQRKLTEEGYTEVVEPEIVVTEETGEKGPPPAKPPAKPPAAEEAGGDTAAKEGQEPES
jgi:hypothetical protein